MNQTDISFVDKLQVGATRLEVLNPRSLEYFLDKSWIHLGDTPHTATLWERWVTKFQTSGFWICFRDGVQAVCKSFLRRFVSKLPCNSKELYSKTNFIPFYYRKGDRFDFADSTFHFVFSEHVLEHFFLDEAIALLKEIFRLVKPNGVVRIVVPDADFRPHPEPLPPRNLPLNHPLRHKTRWNVGALSAILECAGFEAIPLRYYDKNRDLNHISWECLREKYQASGAGDILYHFDYIQRPDSLIVDGFKKA